MADEKVYLRIKLIQVEDRSKMGHKALGEIRQLNDELDKGEVLWGTKDSLVGYVLGNVVSALGKKEWDIERMREVVVLVDILRVGEVKHDITVMKWDHRVWKMEEILGKATKKVEDTSNP